MALNGITNPVFGNNAKEPAWVVQNGQCSDWIKSWVEESWIALFINFVLPTLQISAQGASRFTENAWEIDGASAANSIAKHAMQTASWRVIFFIPMLKLYQRQQHIVINKRISRDLRDVFTASFTNVNLLIT